MMIRLNFFLTHMQTSWKLEYASEQNEIKLIPLIEQVGYLTT